jgi:hypothetical protein
VRYRFESPIHDAFGKAIPATAIVASVRTNRLGTPIVYHLKLDNHGDRADVEWADLAPLLQAAGLDYSRPTRRTADFEPARSLAPAAG